VRIEIDLPWPPSVNHYYKPAGYGKRVLTSEARRFRDEVVLLVRTHCDRELMPIVGPICLDLVFHAPDKKRRDLDNLLKATQDALQAACVYCDDSQIHKLGLVWGVVGRNGISATITRFRD
jgi:crossover junction endodeoxyribonuclease RusA